MSTTFIFGGDIRGIAVQRYLTLYFAVFCTWEQGQPCLTKLEVGHHELKDRPYFVLVKNDRLVCGDKAIDVLKTILPERFQDWLEN
jgi:hypothetical protein